MAKKLFDALRPFIRFVARFPLVVLGIALLLAGVGFYLAAQLRIESDFSKLIPSDYPSVQAIEKLRRTVGSESEVVVVIESPSFTANRRFAEAFIPQALQLTGGGRTEPYFRDVVYRRETGFLKENALYFATTDELTRLYNYLQKELAQTKQEINPFYFDLEEDAAAPDTVEQELQAVYNRLVGKEYPISEDSTAMALRFLPSGAQTDLDFIEDVYQELEVLVDRVNPGSYHPEMEVTLAGRLLRQLIEVQAITQDVRNSFGAGVLVLMIVVVAYFFYKSYQTRAGRAFSKRILFSELARAPLTAIIMGLPLAIALAWTFGLTYLMFETLNIMTSTLGLLLFGLGIDFGIHFYARYMEERGGGQTVVAAIEKTFMTTGQAIAVVAVSTAAAFYVLMIADFKGFSEFGFIAGSGILLALLAMVVVLPALIALLERTGGLNLEVSGVKPAPARDNSAEWRFKGARMVVVAGALGVGLSLVALPEVAFEYHFGSLEPEYPEYERLSEKVQQVYSDRSTRNAAYVVVDDPSEVPEVAEEVRERAAADTTSPTIREVETLQDRFPVTVAGQQEKLEAVARIRTLLEENESLVARDSTLQEILRAAGTKQPIPLEQVPDHLKQVFTSKSGKVGGFVIIYPSVGLSHGKRSMAFADDVGRITTDEGKTYYAGSTAIVASDMLRLMIREAPYMVGLTVLLIVLIKFLILRRPRWVALAMLPLLASFLWMFGLMALFGWKLNFYNLVVLPTVLGIGDDSGVHMVHRYLEEGKGAIGRVLRSTGEHITVSALTTMIGFGGLLISMHPGVRSIGQLAVLGISMTLVAALLLVPAMLQWLEDRDQGATTLPPDSQKSLQATPDSR